MSADLVLITGATGNTGSALLQPLRERGAHVRAMVRGRSDTARLGDPSVETVVADFDDPSSIDAALRGVARAYLVTPSGTRYARGEAAVVSPAVREVTGRDPRDVNAFARDFASAFVHA